MTVMQDLQAKDGNSFAPFCCSMPLTRIRTSTLPDKVLPMVLQSEVVQAVLTSPNPVLSPARAPSWISSCIHYNAVVGIPCQHVSGLYKSL